MLRWDQRYPGIEIDDDNQSFVEAAIRDLNKIKSKPVGESLLGTISKRCQGIGTKAGGSLVQIKYTNMVGDQVRDVSGLESTAQSPEHFDDRDVAHGAAPGSLVRLPGRGTGSVIHYGHNLEGKYTKAIGVQTPAFIALAHELVHALHSLSGDFLKPYSWATDGALTEEARTVGIGPYAHGRITENAIRKEHGLPMRTYYSMPGDADALTAVT
jgi:hypothetical protein